MTAAQARGELQARADALLVRKGSRDQLVRDRAEESGSARELRAEAAVADEAHLWMMTEIAERRSKATKAVESMGTATVQAIYGPEFGFRIETFDEKREKEGSANFKMEAQLLAPYESDGYSERQAPVPIEGGVGGGAKESIGAFVRARSLDWRHYGGPLLWDECFSALSRDGKLDEVAFVARQYVEATGRQIVFVTHDLATFGPVADRVLNVTIDDKGRARVSASDGHGAMALDEEADHGQP